MKFDMPGELIERKLIETSLALLSFIDPVLWVPKISRKPNF